MRRRATGMVALSVSVIIALTGCIGTEEPVDPRPSETPTADPRRPAFEDLIVSPFGLGPLRVARPATDSDMIEYQPDYCAEPAGEAGKGRWPNTYVPRGQPRPFGVNVATDGTVERIDIFDPSLRTRSGIGLGSSVVELLGTYPKVRAGEANTLADLYYLTGSRGTLVFEVANNLIADYYEEDEIATVIMMRVVAPTLDPEESYAGTDFFAGLCLAP